MAARVAVVGTTFSVGLLMLHVYVLLSIQGPEWALYNPVGSGIVSATWALTWAAYCRYREVSA